MAQTTQNIIPPSIVRKILSGANVGTGDQSQYDFDLDPVLDATIAEALDSGLDTKGIENRLDYMKRHGGVLSPIYEKNLVVAEKLGKYNPEIVDENTPIANLPIPQEILTPLLQQGITTVGELRAANGSELSRKEDIGPRGIGLIRSAFVGTAFAAALFSDDSVKASRKGSLFVAEKAKKAISVHKRKKRHSNSAHEELDEGMEIEVALGKEHAEIAEKLREQGIHTLHLLLHAKPHETKLTLSEARSIRNLLDDFGLDLPSNSLPTPKPQAGDDKS